MGDAEGMEWAEATENRRIAVEQIYLASPSRFPVMTDLSCRLISASEA
jgi:hypothetical protein